MLRRIHERESVRLPGYDYSKKNYYFVTICTKDGEPFFGEVRNGIMGLNEIGCIAVQCAQDIPFHFPHVALDEWIVMPNHVHLIIHITDVTIGGGGMVGTQNFASLPQQPQKRRFNKFGPQSKNLSSIIRGFKIGVKKYTAMNNIFFHWQSRFHDRIIRNREELDRIRAYIKNNPKKWERDRNNKAELFL